MFRSSNNTMHFTATSNTNMAPVVTPVLQNTIQLAQQCASIRKCPDPVGLSHI